MQYLFVVPVCAQTLHMKYFFFLLFCLPLSLCAQSWQWVRSENSGPYEIVSSACTDATGNCYVAGMNGISKYTSSGILVWNVPMSSSVAGWSWYSICYSDNHLYAVMDSDAVMLARKFDLNGNLIWSVPFGSGIGPRIAADGTGHLYITAPGIVLIRMDTSGTVSWTQTADVSANSICTDRSGNIYLTGHFFTPISLGTHALAPNGYTDIFVAKYDSSGNCTWAHRAGGSHPQDPCADVGFGVIADTLGNIYVTGSFVDTADFNSTLLYGTSGNEVFLAKYDTSGAIQWARAATGWNNQEGRCVSIDAEGNILVGGSYIPELHFGAYQLNGWGNDDAFVAKYDPNGNFIAVLAAGEATWNEYVYALCTDQSGNIYAAGEFSNACSFGNDSLISQDGYDVFVGKIDFTTGIAEHSMESPFCSAFPNPASGTTQFLFGDHSERTIHLYDQLGREVWTTTTNDSPVFFNAADYSNGLYVYRIEENGAIKASGKLLITLRLMR